ncbi:hypothetical protein AAMO2058_001223500 [Amorphochlora amoebiformis]
MGAAGTRVACASCPTDSKSPPFNPRRNNSLVVCGEGLIAAAGNGDLWRVRRSLSSGVPVDYAGEAGWTALIYGAMYGRVQIVRYLIEFGRANVNRRDKYGNTALILAARRNHLDTVRVLASCGANVNIPTTNGDTALTFAAWKNNVDVVRYLVEYGKAAINAQTKRGDTALSAAAYHNHLKTVRYLTEVRAAVDCKCGDKGETALTYAAARSHIQIVRYLVEDGNADYEMRDLRGNTPLHAAAADNHVEVLEYLIDSGVHPCSRGQDLKTAREVALENKHYSSADFLLEHELKVFKRGLERDFIALKMLHLEVLVALGVREKKEVTVTSETSFLMGLSES